jgi:hypothetical protein
VHIISDKGERTMNITISFDVDGYTDNDELVAWLNAALVGEPIKKKSRKPRKPMTDEEKDAFRARMVKGKEEAAKAQNKEELSVSSISTTTKKSASTPKPTAKKKATK